MAYEGTRLKDLDNQVKTLETQFKSLQADFNKSQKEIQEKIDENHKEILNLLEGLKQNQIQQAATTSEPKSFVSILGAPTTPAMTNRTPQSTVLPNTFQTTNAEYTINTNPLFTLILTIKIPREHEPPDFKAKGIDKCHDENLRMLEKKEQSNMDIVGLLELSKHGADLISVIGSALSALKDDQITQVRQVFDNYFEPNKFIVVRTLKTQKNDMPYYMEVEVEFNDWKGGTKLKIKGFVKHMSLFLDNKKWCLERDNDTIFPKSNWKKTDDSDNHLEKKWILVLKQLKSVIWFGDRSKAKLWLCKVVSSVRFLSCNNQNELFVRLLRDRPSKFGLTIQLWQMIFEKSTSKAGNMLAKQDCIHEKLFEGHFTLILLCFSSFAVDNGYGKIGVSPIFFTHVDICWVNIVTDRSHTSIDFNPANVHIMCKPPHKSNDARANSSVLFHYLAIGSYVAMQLLESSFYGTLKLSIWASILSVTDMYFSVFRCLIF